ncbi:MAG: limonene-1,2-epoxide hydrolase family protein [Jatrophihabitantaceae bacterium]
MSKHSPLHAVPSQTGPVGEPQAVVESFLDALARADTHAAGALLADAVIYTNVGLPTIRGRRRVIQVLAPMAARMQFEAHLHAIAADGTVVLTERTDVLQMGRLRIQFWVAGRFDVHDGQITLWRDSFDYLDCTRAMLRGLLGAVVPSLRPTAPALNAPPGRH